MVTKTIAIPTKKFGSLHYGLLDTARSKEHADEKADLLGRRFGSVKVAQFSHRGVVRWGVWGRL